MNIDDIIENIKNDYYRKLIKNIFNKLDDEEKYVILELNNQLQDKINKIDKAIEYIENLPVMFYPDDFYEENHKEIEWNSEELLEILGDKEIEEIPQFKGTIEQLDNLTILGDK